MKDPEYNSVFNTKILIWTLAPYIPVAKEHLVSAETFARMVLSPEAYEACEKAAFEHVVKGKTWHPTLQGGASAFHPHPGVLCSCQVLGTMLDKPIGGQPCGCPLAIAQIKAGGANNERPRNGIMIYCPEHLHAGSNEGTSQYHQRCIRIIPYFMYMMQSMLAASGGIPVMEQLSKYQSFFEKRTQLITALLADYMLTSNFVAQKLGEDKPFQGKTPAKSTSGSTGKTPSIVQYLSTGASGKKGSPKAIKGKGKKSPASLSNKRKGGKPIKATHLPFKPAMQGAGPAPQHRDVSPSDSKKRSLEAKIRTLEKQYQLSTSQIADILNEKACKKPKHQKGPDSGDEDGEGLNLD